MTNPATILRDINRVRAAVRSHDPEAIEAAWDKLERWLGSFTLEDRISAAHRAGWDAAIEAATEWHDQRAASGLAHVYSATAIRALPYPGEKP